jgi:hypothetical protein
MYKPRAKQLPVARTPSEISFFNLLELAGVSKSDQMAASWLREAITGAHASFRAAKHRPRVVDHNDRLAEIEKHAKNLIKRLERLRLHEITWHAFWRSDAFGPAHLNRVEDAEVLLALKRIVRAAETAKDRRQGRPGQRGKQHVVDMAFAFFVRHSAHQPSGTATGAFARFARAFYTEVTGFDPNDQGGLDRQIRRAATHLAIERQRAQQKSG